MSRVLENAQNQITQGYSILKHKGVDVVKYKSQTCFVIAHTEGEVVWIQRYSQNNPNATGNATYGNCVKIKHPNGYYTLYAHLKYLDVRLHQRVSKGQRLGYMGESGKAYACHLHFEVRDTKDKRINPTKYLDMDLPKVNDKYQSYDLVKKKWLPWVNFDSKDYAGNLGHAISGLRMTNRPYRVYDNVKKKWLPVVYGDSDYAGNLPNEISGVAINNAMYRVHLLKENRWLPWVSGYDINDPINGYAGNLGQIIDGVQIKEK